MRHEDRTKRVFGAIVAALLIALPAAAQTTGSASDPSQVRMTREALQALLASHEESANSSAYSSALRSKARTEAELIRQRLEDGDFQVGDRVVLGVRNEEALTDTFTVTDNRSIVLPAIGEVPLHGVLRSELEKHLASFLGQYIRDPEVTAHSLIRVTVVGGIARPGFYVVRPEDLVTDVLTEAGGLTADADLAEMEITRRERQVISPEALTVAIQQGRTLDQLNMRAGDVINVGQEEAQGRNIFGMVTLGLSTVISLIYLVTRIND